ncbi:DUF3180 domain-containing protein [Zhihengliuella sp.]|uniref:DUF3180 domain-containing protein n=1 Tax=Zhihengliuella sp. TaxID=1954483 RepID=UPI0028126373|nr:DUF3180 domain-containing protein [Zhihengliuella sp.]
MNQIRPAGLGLTAVIAAVLGWGASLIAASHSAPAPVLHPTSLITVGAATLIVLVLGLRVRAVQAQRRRWAEERRRQAASEQAAAGRAPEGPGSEDRGQSDRRPAPRRDPVEMSPLLAARTLILAQAVAYAGSVVGGWHGGVLVDLLGAMAPASATVITAWVMLGAGVVMSVVGWVVEQFCKLPPDDPAANLGDTDERGEGFPAGA